MFKSKTPELCIRCKGRSENSIIFYCDYWGKHIQVSPKEDASFECSYGNKSENQFSIDEWIIRLKTGVWSSVNPTDPIIIKIFSWGYTLNTLPKYGLNPFIEEKFNGDCEREAKRVVTLLTDGKSPIELVHCSDIMV